MSEPDTKDPEAVINDFRGKKGLVWSKESSQKPQKTFECRIDSNCTREIKLDTAKNYICVLTYTNLLIDFEKDRAKALYYVAYINEELNVTSLDVDPDTGGFKLKSSQSFPAGMNFTSILDYFWNKHDTDFDLLVRNIQEFNKSISDPETQDIFDPRNLAKEFHASLNRIVRS